MPERRVQSRDGDHRRRGDPTEIAHSAHALEPAASISATQVGTPGHGVPHDAHSAIRPERDAPATFALRTPPCGGSVETSPSRSGGACCLSQQFPLGPCPCPTYYPVLFHFAFKMSVQNVMIAVLCRSSIHWRYWNNAFVLRSNRGCKGALWQSS